MRGSPSACPECDGAGTCGECIGTGNFPGCVARLFINRSERHVSHQAESESASGAARAGKVDSRSACRAVRGTWSCTDGENGQLRRSLNRRQRRRNYAVMAHVVRAAEAVAGRCYDPIRVKLLNDGVVSETNKIGSFLVARSGPDEWLLFGFGA